MVKKKAVKKPVRKPVAKAARKPVARKATAKKAVAPRKATRIKKLYEDKDLVVKKNGKYIELMYK